MEANPRNKPRNRPARRVAGALGSFVAIGTCVMCCGIAEAQDCVPTPAGAVYWLGGERTYDDLVGYHNATLVGPGVGFATGAVGDGIHFGGGLEDRIYTDTSYAEERALRHAFTIELWTRPTATLVACAESNSGVCAEGMPWAIFPEHGANSAPPAEVDAAAGIGMAIGSDGVCVGEHTTGLLACLARFDVVIADWTEIVVVVEDRTPRIYIDGALAHVGVASDRDFVFASWTVLGSVNIEGYGVYAGDLDEVTIYDRALDDAEIAALFAAGGAGKCKPDCATERDDDLWQGALVTAHTQLRSDRADCMFGATDCTPEATSTLFADGLPDGTVHSVEWQTAAPVTLGSIALAAFHDGATDTQRAFRHFSLAGREIGGEFATIYDSAIELPYGQGTEGRDLMRCARVRPVHAQEFRAEFVQDGASDASGPRVLELDGLIHDPIFRDDFDAS